MSAEPYRQKQGTSEPQTADTVCPHGRRAVPTLAVAWRANKVVALQSTTARTGRLRLIGAASTGHLSSICRAHDVPCRVWAITASPPTHCAGRCVKKTPQLSHTRPVTFQRPTHQRCGDSVEVNGLEDYREAVERGMATVRLPEKKFTVVIQQPVTAIG